SARAISQQRTPGPAIVAPTGSPHTRRTGGPPPPSPLPLGGEGGWPGPRGGGAGRASGAFGEREAPRAGWSARGGAGSAASWAEGGASAAGSSAGGGPGANRRSRPKV